MEASAFWSIASIIGAFAVAALILGTLERTRVRWQRPQPRIGPPDAPEPIHVTMVAGGFLMVIVALAIPAWPAGLAGVGIAGVGVSAFFHDPRARKAVRLGSIALLAGIFVLGSAFFR